MAKKKTKKTLLEFLPALATAARAAAPAIARGVGQAAVGKAVDAMGAEADEMDEMVGPSDSKEYEMDEMVGPSDGRDYEEEMEEMVGPSDGYKPDGDVSEAYLSMLENQLQEEGSLDEFMGDMVAKGAEMGGRAVTTPMRMQVKMAKGLGKGLGLADGMYEDEEMEETYPAQSHYPQEEDPKYPRHKTGMKGEGTSVRDEQSANRGASGPEREGSVDEPIDSTVDEEMYPSKKEYPQDGPYYPKVKEETYPGQVEYPQNKPHFPRVVHVKKGGVKESYMMLPFTQPLTEGKTSAMMQNFIKQATQVLGQLDAQDLVQAGQLIQSMVQSIAQAKRTTQGGFEEGYIAEAGAQPPPAPGQTDTPETQRWLQQFLSQKPPSVSDQQAQQIASQIMAQLGGGAAQAPAGGATPPPVPSMPSGAPGAPGQVFAAPQGPSPFAGKTNESRKFVITKGQLKDALKESILLHEKKKLVDKIVKRQIHEQIRSRKLCASLLNEGPMSNMWQGIKGAGRAFAGGVQGGGEGAQQAVAQGQMQDQAKQAQKMVSQAVKQVEKTKGKFTQETLKSADLINQYHDAVLGLLQVMKQVEQILPGPQMAQLQNQSQQAVGQLQYDLESEKSGIDTFLQSLSKAQPGKAGKSTGQQYTPPAPGGFPSAGQLGKQAKAQADQQRAEENPEPSSRSKLSAKVNRASSKGSPRAGRSRPK